MISVWLMRKLRYKDVWSLHFQKHPLTSSVSSPEWLTYSRSVEHHFLDLKSMVAAGYQHLWKTTLGQYIPQGLFEVKQRGWKCHRTNCAYLGSDRKSWSIQKRLWGYRTERKKGHLWTSPGPLGASKEMSWLLLPTFLPLPHPTSILSSFVWAMGTEHGFLIPHLLLPHILTQTAQGGGWGFSLAWSRCFCLHNDCFPIK